MENGHDFQACTDIGKFAGHRFDFPILRLLDTGFAEQEGHKSIYGHLGGLSLRGQIALEILSQKKDACQYALLESALVVPSKFTYAMIKPAFGGCYGLIKHRWFSVAIQITKNKAGTF